MWHQKTHVNWLSIEDKNMKFFYQQAIGHKCRNRIVSIIDKEGVRIESKEGIAQVFLNYFQEIFSVEAPLTWTIL